MARSLVAGQELDRLGYDAGAISRVENGRRPPTEMFARVCDQAFPGRDG